MEVTMKNKKYLLILFIGILLSSNMVYGENLNLYGESYILLDSNTGRVLYEKNAHKKMPMASTTKIMTALIALENGNLDDKITIGNESVGIEGSSIYLCEGEVISLRDMLYGLMLRSGNDSAVAIASYIGKSTEDFVRLMNQKAKSIGAMNTNFTNPHGLHHELHYSTAYDMAIITKEAFKYEEFENIVGSKSYVANRENNNYYYNKNKTLWEYEGGDGVKTGYTMKSGRCLVSSANRNGMRLIAISLNARDWFNDNYKLLDYGFEKYKSTLIYDSDQFIKKINVINGDKEYVNLVTEKSYFYPLKEGERQKIKIDLEIPHIIEAPIDKGTKIGYIYTYLNGQLVDKSNLIAKSYIKETNMIERILYKIRNN
jgi:D-alanyl-D-alanine carboxypeptidase (penicillin-binding protein 5/6)